MITVRIKKKQFKKEKQKSNKNGLQYAQIVQLC